MKAATILLTDDEPGIRRALREVLEFEGYHILEAGDADETMAVVGQHNIDLLLLDVKMKGRDGLEVLSELRDKSVEFPVIMLTGHGTIDTAIQSTRLGAFDFLQKPPDLNRLLISVRNALDRNRLVTQNRNLRRVVSKVKDLLGNSPVMETIRQTIRRVAPTDARVLVTGGNGTGKELVARWLHEHSRRNAMPFVEVNCAAIPTELIESELFGHEKGAFTGADRLRIGKFEEAHCGTLFLDEIGDLSLAAQAKVLRALQENVITRVGGTSTIPVDVRVIAATNKDLHVEIAEGRFREDVYHRLNVIPIQVPPLRDRREDIPLLAKSFLEELSRRDILFANKSFTDDALDLLAAQEWTGNVRELHNIVERIGILSTRPEIDADAVAKLMGTPAHPQAGGSRAWQELLDNHGDFQAFKEAAETEFIRHQLRRHEWNISATADAIGIMRSHLYNKINKYRLER
jgi:two-component system, NtrC family, nitrogen regulation response regulator NtrX